MGVPWPAPSQKGGHDMHSLRDAVRATSAALAVAALVLMAQSAGADAEVSAPARTTLAITYGEGTSTTIDIAGAALQPGVVGGAEVKRTLGRTRVKIHMDSLPNPQSLGSFYTTYLLWAVAPEGQSANLAE